jgi:membrane protein
VSAEPSRSEPAPEATPPATRIGRMRLRAAVVRGDLRRLAARAESERARHRAVDAVFDMVERDGDVGGGIIAGALAFRFFIWLLPLALVAVAGLGIAADASSGSPEEAAQALGFEGLVSNSIANAAESPNRWYALVVGIPVLVWATRSVLRVLIGAHRLVWTDARVRAPKPRLVPTLRLLGLLLCFGVVSTVAAATRAWSTAPGLLTTLLAVVPYAAIWLLVSVRLPHRQAPWAALVPGAVLLGVGTEVLHAVVAYVITPWALARQGTYGALGVASALLVGLFLTSRLIVAAAVVNATLWDRRLGGPDAPTAR